jgi:excinuclease ABC subunit A
MTAQSEIRVQGAREHNLRGIDVAIPRGSLTTITGVSGSGKSSLAFDTICKEGQRRFVESLSAYARQFLGQMEKPRIDHIEGLSPTVAIDQRSVSTNPRSTVGTITEIYDHLRLLFSRLGEPRCPRCGRPIEAQSASRIADRILAEHPGAAVTVLAPLIRDRKGEYRKELKELRERGFVRARIDGAIRRLDEPIELARYERHSIELVLDRLRAEPAKRGRLAEAVEAGLSEGGGRVAVLVGEAVHAYSSRMACPDCGVDVLELEPRGFSFNSPHGACPRCDGLGIFREVEERLVVPDDSLSLDEGALAPSRAGSPALRRHFQPAVLAQICDALDIPRDRPIRRLSAAARRRLLHGEPHQTIQVETRLEGRRLRVFRRENRVWEGVLPILRALHEGAASAAVEAFMAPTTCTACGGARLRPEPLAVRFRERSIADLVRLPVSELRRFLDGVVLTDRERPVGERLFRELHSRLLFLERVGLGYLTTERAAHTLSGGEAQRIRLATQVGSGLRGILYVLDEPSIGLHQRDNRRLIQTLRDLRDCGNTVLVVEHDEETIRASDHVLDIGPGAGREGGELVAEGTAGDLEREPRSITGAYLAGRAVVASPRTPRPPPERFLVVKGARENNLKDIDVPFPVGRLTCVTGASGSGKSTLVDAILKRALARAFHGAQAVPGRHDGIEGLQHFDKVIEIDQSPIGRTPRSNPATYTKVFDHVRDLFAQVPEALARGYTKGRFSFNVKGGRCEECGGAGIRLVEMKFLPDVEVPCDRCGGRRFGTETLAVRYRDKSITDVLEMTIGEAAGFFANHPRIARGLRTLVTVGLEYMRLGQPSTTLSGGEAQRVKLAAELQRPATGRTLYILDEPTTGLHFHDVRKLIGALQALVEGGNTVVVIEHNLDVVRDADWVVDLGPDGGEGGGRLVYAGPMEGILAAPDSPTGVCLGEYLEGRHKVARPPGPRPPDRALDGDLLVEGASLHNLKSVDVRIPAGRMTVVTGPSGSGKTSLAFDTLFAEGQRRFVECLSTYARQFLGRLERPPFEAITGLAPAIAIDQKSAPRNPRSTVATVTEIHDYLRLLYARLGRVHCPQCGTEARRFDPESAAAAILSGHEGGRGRVLAPLFDRRRPGACPWRSAGDLRTEAQALLGQGFVRVLVDGEERRLDKLEPGVGRTATIDLVIDRVGVQESSRGRIAEAVGQAFAVARGRASFLHEDGSRREFSERRGCTACGIPLDEELTPRHFSFNAHQGACPECHGLGVRLRCSEHRLVAHPESPLFAGALVERPGDFLSRSDSYFRAGARAVTESLGADLEKPWKSLPRRVQRAVLWGQDREVELSHEHESEDGTGSWQMQVTWKGLCRYIEEWHRSSTNEWWLAQLEPLMERQTCPACEGERLGPVPRNVRVAGTTLGQLALLSVRDAAAWVAALAFDGNEAGIAREVVRELRHRLRFLVDVGLDYLQLGRSANTLSGGESQRIRLATQIGNRLTGVIYVLDEPTVGLHPRDTARLLGTLHDLRDLGNTIVVVEHDRETIDAADWIVDLGPGAGHRGGSVVYQGPRAGLGSAEGLTAEYVAGRRRVDEGARNRPPPAAWIELGGLTAHNLRVERLRLPVQRLVAVTGVSGSGKSSLVLESLAPALQARLEGLKPPPQVRSLRGAETFQACVVVDQSPIGTSPKSNPASYLGILDPIRGIMATAPLARVRGYGPGRFSFNTAAGRCQSCDGRGQVLVEMHFLPDVWLDCDECGGRRFNRETLEVRYRDKSIADILDLEVGEARAFFAHHRRVAQALDLLVEVGLDYLRLGQPATTLSGGEAQRLKLARELAGRGRVTTLYLLDEPTTGLHFEDVRKLVGVLHRLVEQGHSVVVIEHNLDVIASADWLVEMGPGGGDSGGRVVGEGPPAEMAGRADTATGAELRRRSERVAREPAVAGAGEGRG